MRLHVPSTELALGSPHVVRGVTGGRSPPASRQADRGARCRNPPDVGAVDASQSAAPQRRRIAGADVWRRPRASGPGGGRQEVPLSLSPWGPGPMTGWRSSPTPPSASRTSRTCVRRRPAADYLLYETPVAEGRRLSRLWPTRGLPGRRVLVFGNHDRSARGFDVVCVSVYAHGHPPPLLS